MFAGRCGERSDGSPDHTVTRTEGPSSAYYLLLIIYYSIVIIPSCVRLMCYCECT